MRKIFSFLSNKYILAGLFFLVGIIFFAQNDLISQYNDQKDFKALTEKVKYLESEIAKMKTRENELKTDTAAIIKYAREKYLMKKGNEDVFVFDTIK